MNSDRRNISMALAFLAGFLFVGQAAAQQNRNAGSGKKSQQSQITRQNSGTSQPNRTKQSQLPQQRTQAGRAVSGQPATRQSNSTGRRTPPASSGTRNTGAANSGAASSGTRNLGTLRQSAPSTGSGAPARASASPQTGNARSPAIAAPSSRNAISPKRTNPTDLGTNPERQPPANRPTRPETNENDAGSTSPSSSAAKPARPTSDASAASSSGTESASRTAGIDSGTGTVAPTEQMVPESGRTALEVYGEETLKEIGLPEELWNVDAKTALHKGTQKIIRDKYGIPKDSTQNLSPEDMLNAVANLAVFDAEKHVNSEKFWGDVSSGGLDVALGSIVSDNLGLPAGVRAGSPASKILDDAGQLATLDLDLGDRGSWTLLNEFQNGKLTPDQFVDRANQIKSGGNGAAGGAVGGAQPGTGRGGTQSPNSRPGTGGPGIGGPGIGGPGIGGLGGTLLGGQGSSGKSTSPTDAASKRNSPPASDSTTPPPGSRGGNTGGGGSTTGSDSTTNSAPGSDSTTTPPGSRGGNTGGEGSTTGSDSTGSTPPGSQNSTTPAPGSSDSGSTSGTEQSDSTAGAPGSGDKKPATAVGTPTHYNIGGATWTVTTYSDGTYVSTLTDNETGEVIRTETGKTQEGSEPEIIKAESSDSSTTTNADAEVETDKADVDTTDVDEYTPGRDGEYIMPLAQRLKYMQSLMQALNDTKWTPGKGGTDSTPNPMNESIGTVPWNYKDSVVRPVDGTSSSGIIPAEAIQQIQDPIGGQGGVINPVKNKDQQ